MKKILFLRRIHISLVFIQIIYLFDYLQLFNALQGQWTDSRLIWDPSTFGDVERVLIPVTTLWMPDFFILDTANTNGFVSITSN